MVPCPPPQNHVQVLRIMPMLLLFLAQVLQNVPQLLLTLGGGEGDIGDSAEYGEITTNL